MSSTRECVRLVEEASMRGDLERVKAIVLDNELAYSGKALELASEFGHLSTVKFLLKVIRQERIVIALERAVERGHVEVVRVLCPFVKHNNTGEALTIAAEQGNEEMVKIIDQLTDTIEHDAALKAACQFNHLPVVAYLIDHHDLEDQWVDAIAVACRYGHVEIAQFIANRMNGFNIHRPMIQAVVGGHLVAINWLLGIRNVQLMTKEWSHLLNRAAALGHLAIINRLLEEQPNIHKEEALVFAAQQGHLDILERLYPLVSDADVVHETAFMMACRHGRIQVMDFYFANHRKGFDTVVRNECLHRACLGMSADAVRWLTKHNHIASAVYQYELGQVMNRIELNPNIPLVAAALLDASLEVDIRGYDMEFQSLLKMYYAVQSKEQRRRLLELSTDLGEVVQKMETQLFSEIIETRVAKFL